MKNKRIQELTDEERIVTQEKGTEAPFTGKFWKHNENGMYTCKVCSAPLFKSDTKLDSNEGPAGLRGWPAFDRAIPGSIEMIKDTSLGMNRTEVVCANCKSHLGHIFDDATETGDHFCINSCSLDFENK